MLIPRLSLEKKIQRGKTMMKIEIMKYMYIMYYEKYTVGDMEMCHETCTARMKNALLIV